MDNDLDEKKLDSTYSAKRNYTQLKFFGQDEFSTRMCTLIHVGQHDTLDEVYEKTEKCDKRPMGFPLNKKKMERWLNEFSKQGMLTFSVDFENNDKVTHKTTKLYDMVLDLYKEDRGIHPIEKKI